MEGCNYIRTGRREKRVKNLLLTGNKEPAGISGALLLANSA